MKTPFRNGRWPKYREQMPWKLREKVWATIPDEVREGSIMWAIHGRKYVISSWTEMLLQNWLRREKNGRTVAENYLEKAA